MTHQPTQTSSTNKPDAKVCRDAINALVVDVIKWNATKESNALDIYTLACAVSSESTAAKLIGAIVRAEEEVAA